MVGDDPDPTVMTARVGSGTAFRRAHEESRGLTGEARLGLSVGSGLCRWSREEKRESPTTVFGDRKTSDV